MTTKGNPAPTKREPGLNDQARQRGLNYVAYNGDHLTGIPGQNLSPAQVAELNDKQLSACLATGLYVVAPAKKEEEVKENE